jgi:DNA-binding transcriptional MocR family regulator
LISASADPAGHAPLRRAIAERLAVSRAIAVSRPESVLVVSGSQQDRLASRAAAEQGVRAAALSQYAISTSTPPGLLLGCTEFADDELVSAVERLATALRGLH